ncbi:50S ribosomal protein L11 methyltransferase [Malonomonas rubra]|uniref:50S ribosomal protein L11 methyltransferase n=1 Tax=Malonomonas rubra TaxID=57040 RepID=UPI0026F1664D|nr:50S ribosomal protein L11 methyltransferase [Malonomonas rubra]
MKEDYQPFALGSRFCILPPDLTPSPGDHLNLIMERGAFGSGEHETTSSCLEALEQMSFTGREKVLDLGSGTGILSIAALLLGAGKGWCIDIEEAAIKNCARNCTLNDVSDRVVHICGTLDTLKEDEFDLILANIYGDILLSVAADLVAKAKSGAVLLLSGILWEYNFDVRQKYERLGCEVIKNRMLEEFSTVLLKKI